MNYKSIEDLSHDLINGLHKIPHDIDLIVGVPRSGMLVANMLAMLMNKQFTDVDGLLNDRIIGFGSSKTNIYGGVIKSVKDCHKVLIVEDTVASGNSLKAVKKKLEEAKLPLKLVYFVAYVEPGKEDMVDCFLETVGQPRLFEWNIFHHYIIENSCMDIDGVLCDDPTEEENDDGEKYINFILNAKPKIIPTRKIKYLVSSRLEKYRKETEEWLRKNHVEYGELIMLNATAEERRAKGLHGKFKAEFYKNHDSALFIESNKYQAAEIYEKTNKLVYCTENNVLYDGDSKYKLIYETIPSTTNKIKAVLAKSPLVMKIYKAIKK